MENVFKRKIWLLIMAFFALFMLVSGCGARDEFSSQVKDITNSYRFELAKWELGALSGEIWDFVSGADKTDNTTEEIITYFTNAAQIKSLEVKIYTIQAGYQDGDTEQLQREIDELRNENAARRAATEKALEILVRETLAEQGIYNPLDRYVTLRAGFPPVKINLGEPPHLLIISPRNRIENIKEVKLLPEMSLEEMEKIESEVDRLGYSSIVEGLGGLSTYPSYILDEADLHFTIETIVHEWMHQYLPFTPLGFRYLLDQAGIHTDYEIATINETVAGMVGSEIGDIIYRKLVPQEEISEPTPTDETGFGFNKEMREIRQAVDTYLAQGEIEQAESFMEQKRQYLAENGYYIRKLNQAYFAFHGTYADSPTSIDPIGEELRTLRAESDSLKSFLDSVVRLTSQEKLAESLD
jgi:hypothetical protein